MAVCPTAICDGWGSNKVFVFDDGPTLISFDSFCRSYTLTTDGIIGDPVNGSETQSITPTPFDNRWTQITELVVPKSIPATDARPLNPRIPITATTNTTTPINDGTNDSNPPEGLSFPCFLSAFDDDCLFFFLSVIIDFVVVVVVVSLSEEIATIDVNSPSLSRLPRRRRCRCIDTLAVSGCCVFITWVVFFVVFIVSPSFARHIVRALACCISFSFGMCRVTSRDGILRFCLLRLSLLLYPMQIRC